MDKLELNQFEKTLYFRCGTIERLKRYRKMSVLTTLLFAALFISIAISFANVKIVIAIMLIYAFINMLELLSFCRVCLGYRGLIRKLKERLADRTGSQEYLETADPHSESQFERVLAVSAVLLFIAFFFTAAILYLWPRGNGIVIICTAFCFYLFAVLSIKLKIASRLCDCKSSTLKFGTKLNELTYPNTAKEE